MNYTDAQKGLLGITIVPCMLLCLFMFRFGRRGLKGNERFGQRMDYCYSAIGALLLGEFIFQAFPNSMLPMIAENITHVQPGHPPMDISIPGLFIFAGAFLMLCYQSFARIWNDSPNYSAPADQHIEISDIIGPEMEVLDTYQASGLNNDAIGVERMQLQDQTSELSKRRRLTFITLLVMMVLCILEGFFLIYQNGNKWAILVVFVVDKIAETFVVCVAMLHAMYHAKMRYNYYVMGSSLWFCVVFASTLPALCDMSNYEATQVVSNLATTIFYALAAGVSLHIVFYYLYIQQKRTDLKETTVRMTIIVLCGLTSWVVGHYY